MIHTTIGVTPKTNAIFVIANEISRLLSVPGSHYFQVPNQGDPNEPEITIRVSDHPMNQNNYQYGPIISFVKDDGYMTNQRNEWVIDQSGKDP